MTFSSSSAREKRSRRSSKCPKIIIPNRDLFKYRLFAFHCRSIVAPSCYSRFANVSGAFTHSIWSLSAQRNVCSKISLEASRCLGRQVWDRKNSGQRMSVVLSSFVRANFRTGTPKRESSWVPPKPKVACRSRATELGLLFLVITLISCWNWFLISAGRSSFLFPYSFSTSDLQSWMRELLVWEPNSEFRHLYIRMTAESLHWWQHKGVGYM